MVDKKQTETKKPSQLFQLAETLVEKIKTNPKDGLIALQQVIQELHDYQVELEKQNKSLREAQLESDAIKKRYADLYNLAPLGYLTVSNKSTIIESNLTICSMLNITHNNLLETTLNHYILPADQDIYHLYFKRLWTTGEAQHCELRLLRSDSSYFWARLNCLPIKNDDGTIKECRIAVSDFSDFKQVEEELQHNEQKLQTLFKLLPVGISVIDKNRQVIEMNPALEQILKLSLSDIQKEKYSKRRYIHSDGSPYEVGEFPSDYAIQNKEATYDNVMGIITEDGQTIWVSVSAAPFVNSTVRAVLATIDITERKKVEQKLWRNRNIIANMRDGVALIDRNFEYEIANDAYLTYTGFQSHTLEGNKVSDIFGAERFEKEIKPLLTRCLQGETVKLEDWYDVPVVGQKYLTITYSPYKDDDKKNITGVIVTIFDLTDHKRTEDDLEKQYAILDRFFAVSPDLLDISDNEGVISRVSKAWETILGYSAEELEGHSYIDLIHPEDREKGRVARDSLKDKKEILNYVNRYRSKSGEYRTLEWNAYHDNGFNYGAGRDITERIQMQNALQENEANLTALIENIGGYVWSIDTNYELIVANTTFKTAFQNRHKIECKLGVNVLSQPTVSEAEQKEWKQYYDRAFAGEVFHLEHFYTTTSSMMDYRFSPIRDMKEQVVGVTVLAQDITARKNMENQLRASEAHYRTLAENFPNGMVALYDFDLRYTLVGGQSIQAPNSERSALIGKHLQDVYPPDIYERGKPTLLAPLRGETTDTIVQSGETHLRVLTLPVRDENDKIIGGMIMSQDITKLKQAENALRQSEARYRTFVENFPNGIVALYDFDLRYTLVSGQGTNRAAPSLLGQRLRDVYPPEVYERDEPKLLASLRGETTDTIVPFGEEQFRVMTLPVRDEDDTIIGGMLMTQNITKLKQVEDALRQSENRFRLLTETLPDTVFVYDVEDHSIGYFNKTDFLGYAVEELMQPNLFRNAIHHSDRQSMDIYFEKLLSGQYDIPPVIIYRFKAKDGSWHWVRSHDRILAKDKNGKPSQTLVTLTDFTETIAGEKRFRAFIEKSSDLVLMLNESGEITYASPAAERITSYEEADLIGRNILNLPRLDIQSHESTHEYLQQILDDKDRSQHDFEAQITGKDNQEIWLRGVVTNLSHDPDVGSLVANLHNVTELKNIIHKEQQESEFIKLLLHLATVDQEVDAFQSVLKQILEQLKGFSPHDCCNIILIEDDKARIVAAHGYSEEKLQKLFSQEIILDNFHTYREVLNTKKPLSIMNTQDHPLWIQKEVNNHVKSFLSVPIVLAGKIIGFFNLHSYKPCMFDESVNDRLLTIASYVAVVIHNYQSYQEIRQTAIRQERERIARDLHDAVSQTLFSASLVAEALPRLVDTDLNAVHSGLDELVDLTKGALAEMRMLLFEMRPSAVEEMPLRILLETLINGFKSRIVSTNINLLFDCRDSNIHPDTKLAIYRIIQEGLNNVVKHSNARQVRVGYLCDNKTIRFFIEDDGVGFDEHYKEASRMGLNIMQERAKQAGFKFKITSRSGGGTRIEVKGKK